MKRTAVFACSSGVLVCAALMICSCQIGTVTGPIKTGEPANICGNEPGAIPPGGINPQENSAGCGSCHQLTSIYSPRPLAPMAFPQH